MRRNYERENKMYDYICSYIKKNGISPTYSEIMEHCGIKSRSMTASCIERMIQEGKLNAIRSNNGSILPRSISVTSNKGPWKDVRLEKPHTGEKVLCNIRLQSGKLDLLLLVLEDDGRWKSAETGKNLGDGTEVCRWMYCPAV